MLTTHTCGKCGIEFGIPAARYNTLKSTGETFTCPNGCRRHFIVGETKEEKEIASLTRHVDRLGDLLRERDAVIREARAESRTCPLCGERFRTRKRLPAHLEDEHGARTRLRALPAAKAAGEA